MTLIRITGSGVEKDCFGRLENKAHSQITRSIANYGRELSFVKLRLELRLCEAVRPKQT